MKNDADLRCPRSSFPILWREVGCGIKTREAERRQKRIDPAQINPPKSLIDGQIGSYPWKKVDMLEGEGWVCLRGEASLPGYPS